MQWLSDQIDKLATWLQTYLLYVPKWCWQHLLEGFQYVLNLIPVPDAFAQFTTYIASIPSSVIWFLDLLQFKYGMQVIAYAYLARFVLRRIPFIG